MALLPPLTIREYCAEEDTCTVRGKLPVAPDLVEMERRALVNFGKTMRMAKMDVLVVITDTATVHVHGHGEIVVNGVKSLEQAQTILEKIL